MTDTYNNVETCTFRIIVVDRIPPVLHCPTSVLGAVPHGFVTTSVSFNVIASDNVAVAFVNTSIPNRLNVAFLFQNIFIQRIFGQCVLDRCFRLNVVLMQRVFWVSASTMSLR